MGIVIIDYEAGNLTSVKRALHHLGVDAAVTRDVNEIRAAERVIFPGVGAAGSAMASLNRLGLSAAIHEAYQRGTPLLGICLGAQIILDESEEDGGTPCLGLVPGKTKRFPDNLRDDLGKLKVPHMGWNAVRVVRDHPVLRDIRPEHEFYFVHSYYPEPADASMVMGMTDYGLEFTSIVARSNLIACQFHLEKSGRPGLMLLENFCRWDGRYA
jgi:glutamine amidotransferase